MKKHLIAIAALLFAYQISNAQTEKGTQNLGLNMSIGYLKVNTLSGSGSPTGDSHKNTSFSIGPDYSFFIADNLDLGFSVSYSASKQEYTNVSPNIQESHGYSAGVYMRKYFLYDGKIGLRTGGHLNYGHDNTKYTATGTSSFYNYDSKSNSFAIGAGLELVAYPAKKLGISASLAGFNYAYAKQDAGTMGKTDLNSFNFSTASDGLTMSVFYVFGGK